MAQAGAKHSLGNEPLKLWVHNIFPHLPKALKTSPPCGFIPCQQPGKQLFTSLHKITLVFVNEFQSNQDPPPKRIN